MTIPLSQFLSPEEAQQLLNKLETLLGYSFVDRDIALQALAHRSLVAAGSGAQVLNNERLEFLGDAVVNWLIVDELFRRYPNDNEGQLASLKSKLTSQTAFAHCAELLQLPPLLQMSLSAERSGTRERPNIQEDLFEAVMGALYLDGGVQPVRAVLRRTLFLEIDQLIHSETLQNWKGELNEKLQAEGKGVAEYRIAQISGPEHEQLFRVELYAEQQLICSGEGTSRQQAEQQAAKSALQQLSLLNQKLENA